jgi:hypothetical protein
MIAVELLAGPMVQTIFVRLVVKRCAITMPTLWAGCLRNSVSDFVLTALVVHLCSMCSMNQTFDQTLSRPHHLCQGKPAVG